ncbi:hypothetical protein [Clostridium thermarum]|uniref:hypothetical protein n=1 Tax=Clostridium thermarum TaxID=1716543 RepID=UPI0013D7B4C1|nr:hypothetical protein [Clostridium thermarum]
MEDTLINISDLDLKIQIMKELLYEKMDKNVDKEEIQQVSEILDMLIVKYLKTQTEKY